MKKALIIAVLLGAFPVFAQSTTGELRLTVTDPAGLAVKSTVELVSQGNEYSQTFTTDSQGKLDAKRLPYGIYQLQIQAQGFARVTESVAIAPADCPAIDATGGANVAKTAVNCANAAKTAAKEQIILLRMRSPP